MSRAALTQVPPAKVLQASFLLLKLVFAPVALVVLIWLFVADEVVARLVPPGALIVVAIALNEVALILIALRMRGTFGCLSIRISPLAALRIHLQSLLYFITIPGSVGMEFARYAKVRTILPETSRADLGIAVVADRVLGLIAACVLSLALFPFVDRAISISAGNELLLAVAIGVLIAGVGVALAHRAGLFRFLAPAMIQIARRPREVAVLLMLSVAGQAAMVCAIYLAGLSVGISLPGANVAFGVSAAMLSMVIPFTIAGIGPVEATGVGLLMLLGAQGSDALILVTFGFAGRLLGALQGAIWEIVEGAALLRGSFRGKD